MKENKLVTPVVSGEEYEGNFGQLGVTKSMLMILQIKFNFFMTEVDLI